MKIIRRYIYRELIAPFFFGVAAFTGIFIGTNLIFDLTDLYTRWGVDPLTLVQLFFLSLPEIIVLTFPMATLLGTIMAFNRLSSDSEITAMRSGGISIHSIVVPALVIGLLTSVVTIGINEYIVPQANYRHEQIVWKFKHGEKKPDTQYNLYLTPLDESNRRPDYILYTHQFEADEGTMDYVVIQEFEEGKPISLIEAESGRWFDNEWHFYNGVVYYMEAGQRLPALKFNEYRSVENIEQPSQMGKLGKRVEDMNIRELSEYISLKEKQGKIVYSEKVKWHQRFSIPLASFIFALLAAPLGIRPQRSGGSAGGLGLSIIVIFIYYTLMTVGDALGSQGTIAPWLGAWLQNIVILIAGLALLYKVSEAN